MSTEKTLEKILSKVESMDNKVDKLDSKVDSLDDKVNSLDDKVNNLGSKVQCLDDKIDTLDKRVDSLGSKFEILGSKVEENTQLLRSLEHASQIHKAELDKLNMKVAKLSANEEKVKKLEDNFKNHDHDITIKTDKANAS